MTTVADAALPGLRVRTLVRATRPKQWIKNLLVVAAPSAAGVLLHRHIAADCLLALLSMTLTASGLYLLNDVLDVDMDRAHPRKATRAVASGALSRGAALGASAVLVGAGLAVAFALSPRVLAVVGLYAALTVLYDVRLKHVAWLELAVVASGFVLRTLAGAASTHVDASEWLLLAVSSAAAVIVVGKRSSELLTSSSATRPVLSAYSLGSLRALRLLASGLLIAAYAGWTWFRPDPLTTVLAAVSLVPVCVVVVRWEVSTRKAGTGAPEDVLLRDPWIAAGAGLWALAFAGTVVATVLR